MKLSRISIDSPSTRRTIVKHPVKVFAIAGLVLWVLSHATGCAAGGSGAGSATSPGSESDSKMPEWAMTAKAQVVDPHMSLDTAEERVLAELRLADLPERHLPAEQLATTALQELRAGHATDAAVWLSLASYRYRQEWSRILRADDVGGANAGSLPAAFYQLRTQEQHVYAELDFQRHLIALGQLLRGEEMVSWDLESRLVDMFRDEFEDAETVAEDVRRKLRARGALPEEFLTAQNLAQAYLEHLRTTAEQERDRTQAVRALADTPLTPFSLEALVWGFDRVNPGFCSRIANQLSTHTEEVVARLADTKGVARANAAVILGMNPDPERMAEIERPWATEKDPSVRLALAYALARSGQRERADDLIQALSTCPAGVCEEAMSLLLWLPSELATELHPEIFVRLANDLRQRLAVRLAAIGILGQYGRKKSLSPRMREVLLGIAREKNDSLLRVTSQALASDAGFSRELVLAALGKPSPAYGPLLARLAHVATVEDLPVLRQHMPRFAAKPALEADALIRAAATVSGADAEALLLSWFDAHPALRRRIAFRLMARLPLQPSTQAHLAASTDRDVRLLVGVIGRLPDGLSLLQEELRTAETPQREFAAYLAGFVRDRRVEPELWSLVNFRDDRFYPEDARVRHTAMSSLLWIALDDLVAARTAAKAP